MRTGLSRITQLVLVAVLIAALAVPGMALAKPQAKNLRAKGPKAPNTESIAPGFKQPTANLEKRISNVLAARARRFAAADANIQKRIDRLTEIADRLGSNPASLSVEASASLAAATEALAAAQEKLDMASANESDTVKPAFEAIAEAENRKAAFFEAKAAGRQSVAYLKEARSYVRQAAHMLRGIVQSMAQTEDADENGSGS